LRDAVIWVGAGVARLVPAIGRALDDAGIAFRWLRYVAFGDGAAQ